MGGGSHSLTPRPWWIVLVCLPALAVAGNSPPRFQSPESQVRVNRILAGYEGKDDLSGLVGVPPSTCLKSSHTTELCEWQLAGRQPGWATLAAAINTNDRINVLCELPTGAALRAPDACSTHPRRSNRRSWSVFGRHEMKQRHVAYKSKVRRRYQQIADDAIANAVTLVTLSRLMGAAPNECHPGSTGQQTCLWRTTNRTFGHGTLVVWTGATQGQKILFHCILPTDGSERTPGSCSAYPASYALAPFGL